MRKFLAIGITVGLILATLPPAAWAGGSHAVRNRWTGFGIGVAAATLGSLLLGEVQAPVYAAAPPVVYAPPPVVYAPAMVYAAPPVAVCRAWEPPGHWRHHGRWHRD